MFKETFERGSGANLVDKNELTLKLEQLTLMRKKKNTLEEQIKTPMAPSEGVKVLKEYKDTLELLNLIENDVNKIKEVENTRLAAKFEKTEEPIANEVTFDAALRQTGEMQTADRLDARRRAA